jgi:hypothetical protein
VPPNPKHSKNQKEINIFSRRNPGSQYEKYMERDDFSKEIATERLTLMGGMIRG